MTSCATIRKKKRTGQKSEWYRKLYKVCKKESYVEWSNLPTGEWVYLYFSNMRFITNST